MQQFLMVFYVVFFATGFMGGTALFLLSLRVRSRLLRPLLVFQVLFLVALGLMLVYFALPSPSSQVIPAVVLVLNAAVWVVVIVLAHRMVPSGARRTRLLIIAEVLAGLAIVKSLLNVVLMFILPAVAATEGWHLSSHIVTALAMVAFGVVLRGPLTPREPPVLRPLLRGYGLLAIVFAPAGLVEYAVQAARIPWLQYISLDHFFYLAWNVVSMSAALRVFKPTDKNAPTFDAIPEERVRALGLSPREVEMAVLIGHGLSNKEIATRLFISPATVRTHIYNLYRKVGAGSRVELINMLRD